MTENWTYDVAADALYVTLKAGTPWEQVEVADGVIIDLDPIGDAVGIEVLSPVRAVVPFSRLGSWFGLSDSEVRSLADAMATLKLGARDALDS